MAKDDVKVGEPKMAEASRQQDATATREQSRKGETPEEQYAREVKENQETESRLREERGLPNDEIPVAQAKGSTPQQAGLPADER